MSVAAINKKQEQVQVVSDKIKNSAATVVVEYAGLTVEEFKELRTLLRAEGVELEVIKNNISRRAFQDADLNLDDSLVGPTAVAFSSEDVTAAARILNTYAKKHTALKLKAGTMEGTFATTEQVLELASLPSKDGLLSILLSVLQAPMRGLAQTVSQVSEQKED